MGVLACGGLARDPLTGTLFAAALDPSVDELSLWTVEPTTGAATVVGPMGVNSSADLAFRSDGTLFSIHSIGGDVPLGTVDVGSGAVTLLGPSGTAGSDNGIAFDADDRLLHANDFTINRLDQSTGQALPLASLAFPPDCFSPSITALTTRGPGPLFGALSCSGSPTFLVTIDPGSGAVSTIGQTVDGLQGLAFDLFCGDGIVSSGEQCDDGNVEDADCCSNACVPAADGTPCSDGLFCDGSEACTSGVCGGGTPPCPAGCDDSTDTCLACPATARSCKAAAKSVLVVRNDDGDDGDKLLWRWRRGAATDVGELGDPTATTDYALCVYAAGGSNLIGYGAMPADAAKWSRRGTGAFVYRDRGGAMRRASVKSGGDGEARALVVGKGEGLADLSLPLSAASFPVVVQLSTSDTPACWESRYEDPRDVVVNQANLFKAKQR